MKAYIGRATLTAYSVILVIGFVAGFVIATIQSKDDTKDIVKQVIEAQAALQIDLIP